MVVSVEAAVGTTHEVPVQLGGNIGGGFFTGGDRGQRLGRGRAPPDGNGGTGAGDAGRRPRGTSDL